MANRRTNIYRDVVTDQSWWHKAVKIMVAQDKSLWQAVAEIPEVGAIHTEEATLIEKHADFNRLLRQEQNRHYQAMADDPTFGKAVVLGKALYAADMLLKEKMFDKALNGYLNVAKIAGYVGAESNVNVFANLNSKEFLELKERLKAQHEGNLLPAPKGEA